MARPIPASPRWVAIPRAAASDSRAPSTIPSGAPAGAASVTPDRYCWFRMLPSTAIPRVPPTSRAASLTAEATPCLLGGSAATMSVVAGAVASAIPAPTGRMPASSSQYDDPASSWVSTSIPRPISARPVDRQGATADPGGQVRHLAGQSAEDHRHRDERQTRLEGRVAEHQLDVLDDQEDEAEEHEELQGDRDHARAEVPAGEQARVQERVLRDQAPAHPGDQADDADGERAQGQRVGPAALGSLDGGEHDTDEREDGQQAADVVDPGAVLLARVRDQAYGERRRRRGPGPR